MTRGLVIGKFYPPHRGHKFLIDTALKAVDHLDVLVCVRADQKISGDLRQQWLQEIHPKAHVQQVEDFGEDDNSEAWAAFTVRTLGSAPDFVFTSEHYGDTYARCMRSQHVLVDLERHTVPIHAADVRLDPMSSWEFLEPCVRAHFVKRICIVGAESTGTTTLAMSLARHFGTTWVPEYGRKYCEKLAASGVDLWRYQWRSDEFLTIARMQVAQEDQLAREADRILISDTDALATGLWHERYLNCSSPDVEALARSRVYNLYILTDSDIPFVQDGLRDGEGIRQWMTRRFEEKLAERGIPWIKVAGDPQERLLSAVQAINKQIPNLRLPHAANPCTF